PPKYQLDALKGAFRNNRREIAAEPSHLKPWSVKDSGVKRISNHGAERLFTDRPSTPRPKPKRRDDAKYFVQRPSSSSQFECFPHQLTAFGVVYQTWLAGLATSISKANRRAPGPAPALESGTHPSLGPVRSHVVVKLSDRGDDVLGQPPDGVFADGVRGGS